MEMLRNHLHLQGVISLERLLGADQIRQIRKVFEARSLVRAATPWEYLPKPTGELSFEEFELIDAQLRAELQAKQFLPARSQVASAPGSSWSTVRRHAESLTRSRPKQTSIRRPKIAASVVNPIRSISDEEDGPRLITAPTPQARKLSEPRTGSGKVIAGHPLDTARKLLEVMNDFSPGRYPDLFELLIACLREVDCSRLKDDRLSAKRHNFLLSICREKYGIFAYSAMASELWRAARTDTTRDQRVLLADIKKLQPMHRGLLTDLARRQFIAWDVSNTAYRMLTVSFDDLEDWALGLARGQYACVPGSFVTMGHNGRDAYEVVHFMAACAMSLRTGVHKVATKRVETLKSRSELVGAMGRPARRRALNYIPESAWLIPITITGREVRLVLDEDFYKDYGGRRQHEVRGHLRRISRVGEINKTWIQPHTRGGNADIASGKTALRTPAVTIRRGGKA
ncbi:hypothetical protein [Arthrobacter sp. 179]|uniref:hypothetical protein n=1 Tax=Arthrobacter sp. 179 TaxID=3457734 RepID=UPI00403395A1